MSSSRLVILIVVGTAGVGSAIGFGRLSRAEPLRSVDAMVDGNLVTVRAPEPGVLRTEGLETGQPIKAGEPVAWLEPIESDLEVTAPAPLPFGLRGGFSRAIVVPNGTREERLSAATARLQSLQKELANTPGRTVVKTSEVEAPAPDVTSYQQAVDSARHEVEAAESVESTARKAHEKATFLFGEGAIARKQVERAASELERASGEVRTAKSRLERAEQALTEAKQPRTTSQTTEETVVDESARTKLTAEIAATQQLIQRLKQTPRTISRMMRGRSIAGPVGNLPLKPFVPEEIASEPKGKKLTSPSSGIVWSQPKLDGQQIAANREVLKILLTDSTWIQASFRASDAGLLRVGATVLIRHDRGVSRGEIESIGAEPFWSSVSREAATPTSGTIPVKIRVHDKSLPSPGVRVTVEIPQ